MSLPGGLPSQGHRVTERGEHAGPATGARRPHSCLLSSLSCDGLLPFSSRRHGGCSSACTGGEHVEPRRDPHRAPALWRPGSPCAAPTGLRAKRLVLALVLSACTVSVLASPATKAANGAPANTKPGGSEDQPFPRFMLGRTVRGPYVRPVEVRVAPICTQFGPQVGFGQVLGGEPLSVPEAKLAFQMTKGNAATSSANVTRAVLLMFHGGLGNTLMSAELGMWYAMLSGRRLLRYDFGPDKGGFEALCLAFKCNLASMPVVADPRRDLTALFDIPFEHWAESLKSPKPLILNNRHSVKGLIRRRPAPFRCIARSLQCSTEADKWCMSSKQLNLLLPMPTDAIRRATDKSMILMSPNLRDEHPEHGAKQEWAKLTQHIRGVLPHLDAAMKNVLKDKTRVKYSGKPLPDQKGLNSINLEFDVAVHIRTASSCVEDDPFSRGCRSPDLSSAVAKAYLLPELKQFVQGTDWLCMLSLVAFLAKQKMQRNAGTGGHPEKHPPFPWTGNDGDVLRQVVKELAPGPVKGYWGIGDSVRLARELVYGPKGPPKMENPQAQLRILLATDSEALRPLFVEFVRPFGTVVHSENLVAHVTRSRLHQEAQKHAPHKPAPPKGHKKSSHWLWQWIHAKVHHKAKKPRHRSLLEESPATLLDAKVASLAEFFLLSKSAVIIGHGSRVSSFLQQAAMYGNTTLITKTKSKGTSSCSFIPGHISRGQ